MAYQFTQTGQEIQDILNQVGDNTSDISALDTRMDTAESDISALNTSLANLTAYTDVKSSLTASTGVTISNAHRISYGKLAGYAIQFVTTASSSVRTQLISGLFAPVNSAAGYAIAYGMNTGTATHYAFAVYSASGVGEIRNLETIPAGTYRLGIIYLTTA